MSKKNQIDKKNKDISNNIIQYPKKYNEMCDKIKFSNYTITKTDNYLVDRKYQNETKKIINLSSIFSDSERNEIIESSINKNGFSNYIDLKTNKNESQPLKNHKKNLNSKNK